MTETGSTVRLENKGKRESECMGRRFAGALIFIFGKLPVYPGTAHIYPDSLYKFYSTFIVFRRIVRYSSRGG